MSKSAQMPENLGEVEKALNTVGKKIFETVGAIKGTDENGLLTFEPKKKKCFIVGFAPSWVETPWQDPDAEIWTLNEAYKLLNTGPNAKVDRWFELHSLERPPKNTKEHIEFLQKLPIPVYTLQKYDFLPNATVFPFYETVDWFKERGHIGHRYFTNSISWILAFAITQGFEEIHIYGVDMAQDRDKNGNDEYGYQKPSCEYFIGVAEKYCKVYIPETSDLLYNTQLYGVESDNERYVFIKKQIGELGKRKQQFAQQAQQAQAALSQSQLAQAELNGAMEAYRTILRKRV